ncbi:MAG: thioredoxin [Clostridia bacterium]|nr:thioredoxin [Clostridia bacterium]
MVHLTEQSYENEVNVKDTLVVIDFWASWCGPCKMLAPIFEKVAGDMTDVKFCKVNVDEEPELARKFMISSIPTVICVKNGEQKDINVGYMGEGELRAYIEKNK